MVDSGLLTEYEASIVLLELLCRQLFEGFVSCSPLQDDSPSYWGRRPHAPPRHGIRHADTDVAVPAWQRDGFESVVSVPTEFDCKFREAPTPMREAEHAYRPVNSCRFVAHNRSLLVKGSGTVPMSDQVTSNRI